MSTVWVALVSLAARGGPSSINPGNSLSRSIALPFLPRPRVLDGSLVGDYGFDPMGIASSDSLLRLREAEVRHGRLAMVATWGWPIAEVGLGIATRVVPPSSVCSGNGCAIDTPLSANALTLESIRLVSFVYWGVLFAAAVIGEVIAARRQSLQDPRGSFDPLGLSAVATLQEKKRLQLAEIKHGRLSMCALAFVWARKWLMEPSYTFAHQLWGETCVFNLKAQAAGFCYEQTVSSFDFVLSWEILFRVLTGYYSEPYF